MVHFGTSTISARQRMPGTPMALLPIILATLLLRAAQVGAQFPDSQCPLPKLATMAENTKHVCVHYPRACPLDCALAFLPMMDLCGPVLSVLYHADGPSGPDHPFRTRVSVCDRLSAPLF